MISMGLKKDIALDNGLTVENAYYRILNISGDKNSMVIALGAYIDRQYCLQGKQYLTVLYYEFVPDVSDDAINFYRQGYAFLKSEQSYMDADDVLEAGQEPL